MSYENAPATRMLATHCAFCGRPLVDAQSVETGVGPVCRGKFLVADHVPNDVRKEGNRLIYKIALAQKGPDVEALLCHLSSLGLVKVVARIRKRLKGKPLELTYQGERIYLKTPCIPEDAFAAFVSATRAIPGRRYEHEMGKGINSFPMDQKRSVYNLLLEFFSGRTALGPKGQFVIGSVNSH